MKCRFAPNRPLRKNRRDRNTTDDYVHFMGSLKHHRIALMLNLQIGYCRRAIMGIAAYGRERFWLLEDMPAQFDSIALVKESSPDGIIAHVLDDRLGRALERLNVPVVNLSSNQINLKLPTIDADQNAVGKMAAEYYWELGYQHYAYFGSASAAFSRERERGRLPKHIATNEGELRRDVSGLQPTPAFRARPATG